MASYLLLKTIRKAPGQVIKLIKKPAPRVTEGFGKRAEFDDFTAHNRGTRGVTCQKVSGKTGKLIGIASVYDTDDIMLITNDGTLIRTHVSSIPVYSRTASGVIVMRLSKGASVVNFAKVEQTDSEEE